MSTDTDIKLNTTKPGKQHLLEQTRAANGMLPAEVYEAICEVASQICGENVVEIGTAHGAATISLAYGLLSQGKTPSIWTVDLLGGKFSSRSQFGNVEHNKQIVLNNFKRAGIDHVVHLIVSSSDQFLASEQCPTSIDLLMLDADGRIDRDLAIAYEKMLPGTPIIIDDADEKIFLNKNHQGMPYLDLKHRITNLLLTAFCKHHYLTNVKFIRNTAFCQRGEAKFDSAEFAKLSINCYRELVFSELNDPLWNQLLDWKTNSGLVRESLIIRQFVPNLLLRPVRAVYRLFK